MKRDKTKRDGTNEEGGLPRKLLELARRDDVAEWGMTFEEEVAFLAERQAAQVAAWRGDSDANSLHAAIKAKLETAQSRASKERAAITAEKKASGILLRRPIAFPPDVLLQPGLCACPEPQRKWYFDFEGPSSAVIPGAVGFENVSIVNNNSGQTKNEHFYLVWSCKIPRDGTFSYWPENYRANLE